MHTGLANKEIEKGNGSVNSLEKPLESKSQWKVTPSKLYKAYFEPLLLVIGMKIDIANSSFEEVQSVIERLRGLGMDAAVLRSTGRTMLQTTDVKQGRRHMIEELDVAGICF